MRYQVVVEGYGLAYYGEDSQLALSIYHHYAWISGYEEFHSSYGKEVCLFGDGAVVQKCIPEEPPSW
jgi:hypothetical protein